MGDGWREDDTSTNTSGNTVQQNGAPVHPPAANQNRILSTARVSRSVGGPKTPFHAMVATDFGTEPPQSEITICLEHTQLLNIEYFQ